MRAPTGLPHLGRTAVVGVVNVTPDSFSDGGRYYDEGAAVRHGLELLAEGADLVDVGGESTRPGAQRVDADEELRRVRGVVTALAAAGAVVSIDTTRSAVAAAAVDAGARVVNDVSAGVVDPHMSKVVAACDVPFVLMHSRGPSADMATRAVYGDVVAEVTAELREAVARAVDAGVRPERIAVDPGLGFAKAAEHNLALLRDLPAFMNALECPVMIGASRKSFLGTVLDGRAVGDRDDATQAITALAAWQSVWAVRVHAVRAAADAVRVVAAIQHGAP
ncbi:MAG: dihydropteroate synthase [Mycobacteriales bacterium]